MVSRIMSMIENAGSRKSRQERFITRFARYYTPAVVFSALLVFLIRWPWVCLQRYGSNVLWSS
jgi:Cd2+/Zn2+-exporting ATPase